METTDLEHGSPASTPAQSLEQLLSSPEARLGELFCVIVSSCLINVTLIYMCSFELLSEKYFQYSPVLQMENSATVRFGFLFFAC